MAGGMSKTKKRVPLGDAAARGFHSPFAHLLGGESVSAALAHAAEPLPAPAASVSWQERLQGVDKVIVRRERKGRGGKTVTLVEGLSGLGDDGLGELLTRLRKALGCGAALEPSEAGSVLVLQGDQGERRRGILAGAGSQAGGARILTLMGCYTKAKAPGRSI